MDISSEVRLNHPPASLPDGDIQRWLPYLEPCRITLGQVLQEPGDTPRYAYFPTTAIVTLVNMTESGAAAEIAVVGNEGLMGISLFMGGESTLTQAVVQRAGAAPRLPSRVLKEDFKRTGVIGPLLTFTQALLTQMSHTAACNRHHSLRQQLCRWLLLSLNRVDRDELNMTHALIANMLGVRREGITQAAFRLEQEGVMRYKRG